MGMRGRRVHVEVTPAYVGLHTGNRSKRSTDTGHHAAVVEETGEKLSEEEITHKPRDTLVEGG